MDPMALPENLRPDRMLQISVNDFPITQTNPVTGYRTSLYRHGADADFLGWIQLMNGDDDAGYVYIRRPVGPPLLGSSRYVVMDIPRSFWIHCSESCRVVNRFRSASTKHRQTRAHLPSWNIVVKIHQTRA
jgi:hypothetical protein